MRIEQRLVGFAPVLAAIAGIAYAVEGAIVTRAPQPDSDWHASGYAVEAAFVVALIASIPIVPVLAASAGRLATVSTRMTQLGFAAMLASALPSLATGGNTLGPAFLVGVLASLAGLLGLSVAALRSRASGWRASPLCFAGLALSIALGNHGGGILFGIAWIGISIIIRDPRPARATPSTV
jgi:hypothetical protein